MAFRLDYIRTDGQTNGAVRAELIGAGLDCEDFRSEHASTARAHAEEAAVLAECDVLVSRVAGEDARPCYIITPGGQRKPPPGVVVMSREVCKRETGACFCSACRAERRAKRRNA